MIDVVCIEASNKKANSDFCLKIESKMNSYKSFYVKYFTKALETIKRFGTRHELYPDCIIKRFYLDSIR